MTGPMSLLMTIAATHRLSTVDKRLPGLGTRRRVPTVDSSAHTPQSLLLPVGRRTCAALATVSRSSAPGHTDRWPPGAMRSVLTAVSHVRGHWGELPSSVGTSTVYSQLHGRGQEVVGGPMPHILLHRAVKVYELRAAQLNIRSDEGGSRSL